MVDIAYSLLSYKLEHISLINILHRYANYGHRNKAGSFP